MWSSTWRSWRTWIRSMRSSARKWKITRVSWRMRTPASMISRAKTGSSNHRRARGLDEEYLVSAFSERTQVGRGAIVAGLRLTPSGALWADSDDGLEDASGTLPGSSKADTPENSLSSSPFQYRGGDGDDTWERGTELHPEDRSALRDIRDRWRGTNSNPTTIW